MSKPLRQLPIDATFDQLRRRQRRAMIPFVMGGDPSLETTAELLPALEEAGADLIEVGLPFSDPLADGPIIQGASARAVARGATPSRVFSMVAKVRRRLQVPVVCLSYWNLIAQFDGARKPSIQSFVQAAKGSGISGVIVPDLPIEEAASLRAVASREAFATIFLAAPTSPPQRLRAVARASQGFIYYVSVTGTTGVRRTLPHHLVQGVRQLKLLTTKPVCVGFGISTPAQAASVARIADGVIIGSALIQAMQQAHGRVAARRRAVAFLKRLRQAV